MPPTTHTATTSSDNVAKLQLGNRAPTAGAIPGLQSRRSFVSRWGGELAFDNWHSRHTPAEALIMAWLLEIVKNCPDTNRAWTTPR